MQEKGLDAQRRALELFCAQKGFADLAIYEDFGVSGTKQSRPGLDKLMQATQAREVNMVIVYSFSRFARSTKHLILALEEFQKHGVAFISITENIDTSTPLGRTIFQIIASISELERALIAERVRNGLKAAKARGKRLGAVKKHTNPEPFIELRKSGMSVRQIAVVLKCSPMTVTRMLRQSVTLIGLNGVTGAVT
jgi:DNA invertase Pin-like site-specific DNA recombinase